MLSSDQFMDIALLHKEGRSLREIAKLTGHSRNTIRRVIREKVPRAFRTPSRPSKLNPFKDYLRAAVFSSTGSPPCGSLPRFARWALRARR